MTVAKARRRPHSLFFRAQDGARRGIDRVMDLDHDVAASIFTEFDAARITQEAEAMDQRAQSAALRPPLLGVTMSIKDLFDETGCVTGAGSAYYSGGMPAGRDALVISRLKAAGVLPFGRTNMSELAYSGLGLNPHYGTPSNALDDERVSGGSSSGAAASVALGLCDAALGTDTGGSVRIPAAFNGLFGFKPSSQSVPMEGVFPLSGSYDSIGPLARSLDLCADLYSVLSAQRRPEPTIGGLRGIRIGLLETVMTDDLDDQVSSDFDRALRCLRNAGADIEEAPAPFAMEAKNINPVIVGAEAYQNHRAHMEGLRRQGDPFIIERVMMAHSVGAPELHEAREQRRDAIDAYTQLFTDYDVLIAPTTACVAPTLDDVLEDFKTWNALALRNTSIINMTDGCAVTVPMQAPNALGSGLMVMAENGGDWKALEVAGLISSAIRWQ
ncbi:amidase [Rhodobacteraceae bacterium RKSG542]|uniref:amidase family protein n=1 Tax=Pseudovibrio flavus TaxID=2529854 RepID=UPI0012BD14D0|nr:amidase family protein [Pseudovibrio flavus]MTI16042.1 amidase [Pseudovibrio flavus]